MSDVASQANQPLFSIEKIYLKDLSVEVPNAPQIFLERESPQVDVQLHHNSSKIDEGIYHTLLTVTVSAKVGEKTMFLVEAGQAGIFTVKNIPDTDVEVVLAISCPNILFPYARQAVSDALVAAGFPPVLLNPVNFEALYAAQKQADAGQVAAPAAPAVATTH
ncbi:MAG: protein-export chaperone SecB [Betaproteobacteria bacterium]|nr:protein-export chaperone SecB [Betaproteobacteria bacterium]